MKSVSLYQLKVRVKLVDTESKFFRQAEREHKKNEPMRNHFYLHRVLDTRSKARHLQLAYAYLRGMPYAKLEHNPKTKPNLHILKQIVKEHTGLDSDLADPKMVFCGKGFDHNVIDSLVRWLNGTEERQHTHLQS